MVAVSSATVEDVDSDVECSRPGCHRPADGEASPDLCSGHRADQRRSNAEHMARKRMQWEEQKRCTRCGGVRHQGRVWCYDCLRSLNRIPPACDVDTDVEKRDRVKSRIIAWDNSPTNAGRKRLRGGSRGRRPLRVIDEEDIASALKALRLGAEGVKLSYDLAEADPSVRLPKVQRDDVRNQGLARLVEAGRWIVEVVKRHGYEIPIQIVDDDD